MIKKTTRDYGNYVVFCSYVMLISIPLYAHFGLAIYETILTKNIVDTIKSDGKSWKVNYDITNTAQTEILTNLCVWQPGDCADSLCDTTKPCIDYKKSYLDMASMTYFVISISMALMLVLIIFSIFSVLRSVERNIDNSNDDDISNFGCYHDGTEQSVSFIFMFSCDFCVISALMYICCMLLLYCPMLITLYVHEFDFNYNFGSINRIANLRKKENKINNDEIFNELKYYWNFTAAAWLIVSLLTIITMPYYYNIRINLARRSRWVSDAFILNSFIVLIALIPSLICFICYLVFDVYNYLCGIGTTNGNPIEAMQQTNSPNIIDISHPPLIHNTSNSDGNFDFRVFNQNNGREKMQNEPNTGVLQYDVEMTETNTADICPICLVGYSEEKDYAVSRCGHKFHCSCLMKVKNNTCPICRGKLEV